MLENDEDKVGLTRTPAGLCIVAGRACGSPPGAAANEPTTWE